MLDKAIACALAFAMTAAADTVVLRSGRSVNGTYLGGDAREVRIAVGDRVERFGVHDIESIRFGAGDEPEPARAAAPAARREPAPILRPERPLEPAQTSQPRRRPTHSGMDIPAGTPIVIRLIDPVDSREHTVGTTFQATVDEPVVVNGETLIPRGADVVAKLVEDKQSGKLSGRTELTLDLESITIEGRKRDILTSEVTQASESRTKETAKVAGGTAALGAIIGAIAGGGKGAAIGAVTGAAAGGAVQVMTKGERVYIPSESRLTFTLQQALPL